VTARHGTAARVRSLSPATPEGADAADAAAAEAQAAVVLAKELFGEPQPMMLLRQEGVLRVMGWILGRGRADCREAGQLAHIVGIDVILMGDGYYAVSERTATDGMDGLSRLDARCQQFDSAAAARSYCEDEAGDETRKAARVAALDHAVRRWPPFRGGSAADRVGPIPFLLD
jgi:hypothetical protein